MSLSIRIRFSNAIIVFSQAYIADADPIINETRNLRNNDSDINVVKLSAMYNT